MKRDNLTLIITVLSLLSIGLLELFFLNRNLFNSQLVKVVTFLVSFALLWKLIRKEHILNYGQIIYYVSILLLILVLFIGKGKVNRWINLGFMQLQPSEIAKIGLIFMLAKTLSHKNLPEKTKIFRSAIFTFIPFLLVMAQPDLGTALTFLAIAFLMTWFGGLDPFLVKLSILIIITMLASAHIISTMILLIILVIILAISKIPFYKKILTVAIFMSVSLSTPIVWQKFLKPYQRERITAFLNPEKSKSAEGWQIYQAKIAIGSGGILGKGLGKGTQKGLAFLPAAHTDFIFSSIAEEVGLLGLIVILAAFTLFFTSILKKIELQEGQDKLILVGIFTYFFFHFSVNIFSNISLLPVVGIPLPFLTYGGSHILAEIFSIFIVLRLED